jgi:hypothetical protein
MTSRRQDIKVWPPVEKLVDDELSLPSSEAVSILEVIFGVALLFLERLK